MAAANLTLSAAGVDSATELGALVAARAEVLALTDATAQAIVSPQVPGGISHGLRAGFACRVARLNGETALPSDSRKWWSEVERTKQLRFAIRPIARAVMPGSRP